MTDATAFWITAPGRGELRREALPEPGPDEVLVETRCSAISRGTERLVFQGLVPASQHETMRAPFQAGEFPFPIKYGYAAVGRVVAGSRPPGERVFCLHPHQDRFVVPASAAMALPPEVPDERAVLAANMETALNGVWDAPPRIGDRVAVVGAGVVGALAAALAAGVPETRVELIDLDPDKAAVARALGVPFRLPGDATGEADLVIHASGSADGLATSLGLAAFEATVLELSWYGDRPVQAPLGEAFHSRRLVLRSSQVGTVAAGQRARWSRRRRLALAIDLLRDARFDALLAPARPFERLPEAMAELMSAPSSVICQVIAYR